MPFCRRRPCAHRADAKSSLDRIMLRAQEAARDAVDSSIGSHRHTLVDVSVQFIGANGLPKMDVIGSADPYFVATIDDKIKFTCVHFPALRWALCLGVIASSSSVQPNTLSPVWNELWHVKNVPTDGKLKVTVYDKDVGLPMDDYIGAMFSKSQLLEF
jgi:Ca2+-dependent lipid-binding protein